MKTKEEITERLKKLKERKAVFEETYLELNIKLPESPNQFNNPEYKYISGQIELLLWVIKQDYDFTARKPLALGSLDRG